MVGHFSPPSLQRCRGYTFKRFWQLTNTFGRPGLITAKISTLGNFKTGGAVILSIRYEFLFFCGLSAATKNCWEIAYFPLLPTSRQQQLLSSQHLSLSLEKKSQKKLSQKKIKKNYQKEISKRNIKRKYQKEISQSKKNRKKATSLNSSFLGSISHTTTSGLPRLSNKNSRVETSSASIGNTKKKKNLFWPISRAQSVPNIWVKNLTHQDPRDWRSGKLSSAWLGSNLRIQSQSNPSSNNQKNNHHKTRTRPQPWLLHHFGLLRSAL